MNPSDKVVLDIDGVIEMTTLSQSTIYSLARKGEFPKQVRIGPNRVVWRRADVLGWLERKLAEAA
jgi:prophage regulatory protein